MLHEGTRRFIRRQIQEVVAETFGGSIPRAFFLVDGQYGSTGKGLAASVLAEAACDVFDAVTSNAGPNSGHTYYSKDCKVVLQQLPTFGVVSQAFGKRLPIYLNAGAVIDEARLNHELNCLIHKNCVSVHPYAAKVDSTTRSSEESLVDAVGSTGKGTGAAIARKVMRDPKAVFGHGRTQAFPPLGILMPNRYRRIFVEVSQGYSLSLNAGGFYPYCTSRDCTVAQAMLDAGLHPDHYAASMMVVRTFPIRVAGNSGPCYTDQEEVSWEQLGVEPETTTVTRKVRRVFTWSNQQFIEALHANRPDMLFFNFMNYLPRETRHQWIGDKMAIYRRVLKRSPTLVLLGYGPRNEDVDVAYV
jgi:adenylosuccinate synthase